MRLMSIGGFKVLPDYDVNTLPDNHAGLVLIGGMSCFTPEAEQLVPLVEKAIKENKLVAGICNASVFLGKHGFLNNVKHTSAGWEKYVKALKSSIVYLLFEDDELCGYLRCRDDTFDNPFVSCRVSPDYEVCEPAGLRGGLSYQGSEFITGIQEK
ncbi:MAG TPA: hypothetical protein DEQ30_08255 [Porphyromonadaceae bacterium]|nr:hypothetical protein [Porphyromonadaceae bacterium]